MKQTTMTRVEVATWWVPRGDQFKLMASLDGYEIATHYYVGWLTPEGAALNAQNGYDILDEGWHWGDDECWRSHDELYDYSDSEEGVLHQAVRSKLRELAGSSEELGEARSGQLSVMGNFDSGGCFDR